MCFGDFLDSARIDDGVFWAFSSVVFGIIQDWVRTDERSIVM